MDSAICKHCGKPLIKDYGYWVHTNGLQHCQTIVIENGHENDLATPKEKDNIVSRAVAALNEKKEDKDA